MDRKNESRTRGLVIAAHGSAKNPNTRKPICACVQKIRSLNLFDEVRCALWQEEPHFSTTLERMDSDDLIVVPFFISAGYYTEQVIPREMGLSGVVSLIGDRTVRLTRPVGDHPGFGDLIVQRANEAGAKGDECLVVLGHGTARNPNSEKNVYAQAERARASGVFPEVVTVFLDQEPSMLDVWSMTEREAMVMVPLFVANGWHVAETIPEELAEGNVSNRSGRRFIYADAVGTDPELYKVVLGLAQEAEGF